MTASNECGICGIPDPAGRAALREAVQNQTIDPAPPATIVIFGATGDLAERKLAPALYNLRRQGYLADEMAVLGVATREISSDALRDKLMAGVEDHANGETDPAAAAWLAERITYLSGDFADGATYDRIAEQLVAISKQHGVGGNVLFYLSTPPRFFGPIVEMLRDRQMLRESDAGWRRVIVEKPFGHDAESAAALNRELLDLLDEDQIYRIDHYLGKETVQNIEFFRFGNGIFQPIWNRQFIDHVQITVAEDIGVGHRAKYFEHAGTLRDMVPNHLFQLLALIAMDPPSSLDPHAVRNEKAKLFEAVEIPDARRLSEVAVRGQYDAGKIKGESVPSYRAAEGVAEDSPVETFAAMELHIENWRWVDVPFYLRVGKRLPRRTTEIVVQFKRAPLTLFPGVDGDQTANQLVLRIQPREGIELHFGAKIPGPASRMGAVVMDFCYADYFGQQPSTGYETLLYDCLIGDATLFQRADHVERCWQIVAPVLDYWNAEPPSDFPNYAAGSWGPAAADELIQATGRQWRNPS